MRSYRRVWIARRAIDLVMLVLLVAGVMKAVDITQFASDLRTWTLFPRWVPLVLAPIIPAVEIGISLSWFLGIWRRPAVFAAAAMLLLFTLVYSFHLIVGEAPKCGCLGMLEAFKNSTHQAAIILTRNGLLLALLLGGALPHARRGRSSWDESVGFLPYASRQPS